MKKNVFGNFIPMIVMLAIIISGHVFKLKGVYIIGIVVGMPISFFIEGIICSRKNIGWMMPLVTLLITFFIVLKLWIMRYDPASVYYYLKYYVIAYILGYVLETLISVLKNKLKKS